jgi:WD40 repeat protein
MIVTGDKDGLVKIWNSKKQLVREIKFVGKINSVAFLNQQGDLIVGHAGNLSRLDFNKYKDKKDPSLRMMIENDD